MTFSQAMGLAVLIALYYLPTIIAAVRHHHNTAMLAVLNTFLGWTIIGWVIFLAMAFGNPAPTGSVTVYNNSNHPTPTPTTANTTATKRDA